MLDIKFIIDNQEYVKESLGKKGFAAENAAVYERNFARVFPALVREEIPSVEALCKVGVFDFVCA